MKFPAPAAPLAPPVSSARLSAAGFVNRKFAGASASSRKPVASRALASPAGSPALAAPAASRSLASCDAVR